MRRSALPGKWLVWIGAFLLLTPILVVVTAPFHTPSENWTHALQYTLPDQLFGTLRLMLGSAIIALLFGTVTAWLISVYDFIGRSILKWALVLPLGLPTYIAAYIYGDLLGPTGKWSGKVADWFAVDIMNETGLMVIMASVLYPYVYLPARALFSYGSGQLQEAALTLGADQMTLFRRVGLPLARPALAGGALLVCMEVMNDYGAVKFFGVQTLTTGIFKSWFNMGDLGTALRIGTILLVLVGIMRFIERKQQSRVEHAYTPYLVKRRKLKGKWGLLAFISCTIPVLLGAIVPLFKIVSDLFDGHWAKAMEYDLITVLGNTLIIALAASALTLIIAAIFLYARRHGNSPLINRSIDIASLGYVIPGAVIAVGVMTVAVFLNNQLGLIMLIGTLGLLIFALVVRFLAVGSEPMNAGLSAVEKSLDEVSRTLGANPLRIFIRVDLPLIKKSLIAATILVFIEVVKELPLTLILRPFNFDTLATKAFEFASIELLEEASVAAAFIVICSMIPVLFLERAISKR